MFCFWKQNENLWVCKKRKRKNWFDLRVKMQTAAQIWLVWFVKKHVSRMCCELILQKQKTNLKAKHDRENEMFFLIQFCLINEDKWNQNVLKEKYYWKHRKRKKKLWFVIWERESFKNANHVSVCLKCKRFINDKWIRICKYYL